MRTRPDPSRPGHRRHRVLRGSGRRVWRSTCGAGDEHAHRFLGHRSGWRRRRGASRRYWKRGFGSGFGCGGDHGIAEERKDGMVALSFINVPVTRSVGNPFATSFDVRSTANQSLTEGPTWLGPGVSVATCFLFRRWALGKRWREVSVTP